MKNALRVLLLVVLAFNFSYAQTVRAKLKIEGVTPHKVSSLGLTSTTNSVSTGLHVVGNQTYVYVSPQNIGTAAEAITNAAYEITSKPAGSASGLTSFNTNWAYFQPDVKGAYNVKLTITTASGSDDTTITIYSADYIGVGNFEGVDTEGPSCLYCHESGFSNIFSRWSESGHAKVFQRELETSDHYGTNCMKCHTTGYDHNNAASNNGFDDIAAQLGWSYTTSSSTTFDSLVQNYPGLVNHATIGCESCHGPGSLHATEGSKMQKIAISTEVGACAQCHDEPWRHNKVAEFENSMHAEAIWSSSFKRATTDNSISDNCARCHDATGYVAFTKGEVFNSVNLVQADHIAITCATCHDPHGNSNAASLRMSPAASDTLGNGYKYTISGTGKICMDCHKSRRNANTYAPSGSVNSHWGPHHSTQGDVLLGKNAADFGSPFMSGNHYKSVENTCAGCHMVATPENGHAERDKVGGHSFRLRNPETGYEHVTSCNCHGPVSSFEDFVAATDYDADGSIEPIQNEIDGLLDNLYRALPPAGVDSISLTLIGSDPNARKAYYNWQLIAYDGSRGMHNTKFAIDVLTQSIRAVGGVVPVELVSFNAEVENGLVILKWETATETNNKGFEVERKFGETWKSIKFVEGKGTSASSNSYSYSFKLEGKASFRLKQVDLDGSVNYSKVIEVAGTVLPKEYTLAQNYPNPFNPSTTIRFSLPYDSNVKVVIYSITGEVVKTLVNTVQSAGSHEVSFSTNDAGINLSSGIYFYSLEANATDGSAAFKQTKKMVLMK